MKLQVSVLSKTGGRAVNEDACGFWSSSTSGVCFCVVSDGAGGHGGGDIASKLIVECALEWFRGKPECSPAAIDAALRAANDLVVARQGTEPRLSDMRATAVVLAVDPRAGLAAWGHVGDSRLYLFRGGRLTTQTRDHSVVQHLVDAGYVDEAGARRSAQRGTLLAALGDRAGIQPSVTDAPQAVVPGDLFLLCSDGLWEHIDSSAMERALARAGSPESWLRSLEDEVLAHGGAGHDNYSGLVLACV